MTRGTGFSDFLRWRVHYKFLKVDGITAGPDGIANTSAAGDDVQVIPVGNGLPNEIAILPGLDGILDSTPSGDDQIEDLGPIQVITTGAKGKLQTEASGDDIQRIPVGQGEANVTIITPGPNGILESTVAGDDSTGGGLWVNDGSTTELDNADF